MTPLSDAQAQILSAACARDNGLVFPVIAGLKGGAVGNVCKSLLKRGLIAEIPAADPDTVWRHDDARGPVTLRATSLGRAVLGIEAENPEPVVRVDPTPPVLRKGTKQSQLIAMLRAPDGATIDEIVAALQWQAHTARGVLSGALNKKLGLTITSEKVDGRGRAYKIAEG